MAHADGTPVWFELVTPDQDASQAFYAAVAGWTIAPSGRAEQGDYRIVTAPGGGDVGGLMTAREGMPAGWTPYFAADDVDALAARVAALGGAVRIGPRDIPHVGRFAAVADPQGIGFSVISGMQDGAADAFRSMDGEGAGHGAWIELATPDPDAAFAFYGALFGWTKAGAMPMGPMGDYAFIGTLDDGRPGAIMPSVTTGATARWNWYVQVPDIDAAVAAARGKGGALLQGPDEIPGGSFSANLSDPQGATIGLVGPRKGAA